MSVRIDQTHQLDLKSWVESSNNHAEFPVQNLPLGIFSDVEGNARPGVAIGDEILDLRAAANNGLIPEIAPQAFATETLNGLLGQGAEVRRTLRLRLSKMLSDPRYKGRVAPLLHRAVDCRLHLPVHFGGYTDFYAGIHHARRVGTMFRPDNPLMPNYKYIPIGYNGRASSIRISGDPVRHPYGQHRSDPSIGPVVEPARRLDYEVELGVVIGRSNPLGEPIKIGVASDYIAGLCLLNDWSARDLQTWEYQPLGPFLSKTFHSTVSPWLVTPEALAPFRRSQDPRPDGDPAPLPYLWDEEDQANGAYAIDLDVRLATAAMKAKGLQPTLLSTVTATDLYWTLAQLIAHHTVNGTNLQVGDLLGTGTISGPTPDHCGSMLELGANGQVPILLPSGETRTFLEDGDTVLLTARASAPGAASIGFGSCEATILPPV